MTMAWKIYTWGAVQCGLYKQAVFIYRWSLEQVGLYSEGTPEGTPGPSLLQLFTLAQPWLPV